MGNGGGWDSARWVAGVAGAVFQVGATVAAGVAISEVVSEGPSSLVEPAGYAFGVWAVIFSLSLLFAVYQALPANLRALRGGPTRPGARRAARARVA